MKHVHLAELERDGGSVFAGLEFATPWSRFDYWALEPGKVRVVAGEGEACEQGYVLMGGPVELDVGSFREGSDERKGFRGQSGAGPGFIIGPVGYEHALENLTERVFGVFHVRVELAREELDAVDPLVRGGAFEREALKWRDAIHGGSGQIATRHVLKPEDFHSPWTFLDHAILGAGGSVGYHYHDALEESFVVLKGEGLMTIDDKTFEVGPGSVTWQGIGQGHGVYNPGSEELEFARIAVAQRDEEYTTIDLHDDLSARRPA
jgi:mannose-6-phosphate isomerase-like protein (cupin superfamily)